MQWWGTIKGFVQQEARKAWSIWQTESQQSWERLRSNPRRLAVVIIVLVLFTAFAVNNLVSRLTQPDPPASASPAPSGGVSSPANPQIQDPPAPVISNEDREKAKQVAVQFLRVYLTYDAQQPKQHLQNSRPYMTAELFEREMGFTPQRSQVVKRTVLQVQPYPVHDDTIERYGKIGWTAMVTTQTEGTNGKEKETSAYTVVLQKEGGKWLVERVDIGGDTDTD